MLATAMYILQYVCCSFQSVCWNMGRHFPIHCCVSGTTGMWTNSFTDVCNHACVPRSSQHLISSLANMLKVAKCVTSCLKWGVVELGSTTHRLALAALSTVTGQLHSPGRGGDVGMSGSFLIALVTVENRLVFPKPPFRFFLLSAGAFFFLNWISNSDIWAFLVLGFRLSTWHSKSFLCVEGKAGEGSTCAD